MIFGSYKRGADAPPMTIAERSTIISPQAISLASLGCLLTSIKGRVPSSMFFVSVRACSRRFTLSQWYVLVGSSGSLSGLKFINHLFGKIRSSRTLVKLWASPCSAYRSPVRLSVANAAVGRAAVRPAME